MFVECRGTEFALNECRFFARGVNCYFLGFCSDGARNETLAAAQAMGANTVRAWAFLDADSGTDGSVAFQFLRDDRIEHNDGPYGLERLDHLLWRADELGVKLILPLVNGWPDFGGMPAYLRWLDLPESDGAAFYRDRRVRDVFRRWTEHVLTRRNSITGRVYCDEPAVLAWELANEARCTGAGGRDLLLDWIAEMSGFAKSLDGNHLVACGDEGFFARSGKSHLYDGRYGVDFEAILQCPGIDFGTFHMYPEQWGQRNPPGFASRWIEDHVQAGVAAGKPVMLEEFGWLRDDDSETAEPARQARYGNVLEEVEELGGAGALAWMLGNDSEETGGFRDGYTFLTKPNVSRIFD